MNDENDFLGFEEEISTTLEQYHDVRGRGLSERAAMAEAMSLLDDRIAIFAERVRHEIVSRLRRDTEDEGGA